MTEFEWIETYFAPLADADAALGLKDDAAVLNIPDHHQLVITTDTINEGIHFPEGTVADLIARKALRVNLSDLAAMGATPLGHTLNLSLPKNTTKSFIASFCNGLKHDQHQFQLSLLGGDTTATEGPLSVTITAYGTIKHGQALTRSGAQANDRVYVSGTIGDAAIGLKEKEAYPHCYKRYQLPEPRLAFARSLHGIATTCMDISDGLIQDLGHLCRASGLGAQINGINVPLSDEAQQWLDADGNDIRQLLTGGDDYELLFTAPESAHDAIQSLSREHGLLVTEIGVMTTEKDVICLDENQQPMAFRQGGYQHF